MASASTPPDFGGAGASTAFSNSRPPIPAIVTEPDSVRVPPPFRVADLDQTSLLIAAELRLAPNLRVAEYERGVMIVKNESSRGYLTMTPEQWNSLRAFGEGRTVPQVVFRNIVDRISPPLREFYELVVKAQRVGILLVNGLATPAPVPATSWRLQIPGKVVRLTTLVAIVVGLVAVCVRPMQAPAHAGWLVAGWALICLAVSAGNAVAACVARHARTEVYGAAFRWKSLLPRFTVDLADAKMAGPQALLDVALARLLPLFLVLIGTSLWLPAVTLPIFCAVLAMLSPLWWSPALVILNARYGTRRLDALHDFEFEPNRVAAYMLRTQLRVANWFFLGLHFLFAGLWFTMILVSSSLFLRANAEELWERYVNADGFRFTALGLLVVLVGAIVVTLGVAVWGAVRVIRETLAERARYQRKPRRGDVSPEAIRGVLAESTLFSKLPGEDREQLAAALQPEEFAADSIVVREGDVGDKLYLLYSGEVEVLRALPSGRQEIVATLEPGDVFGEVALLHSSPRTRTVRATKTTTLLSLPREVFADLVLTRVSREAIVDAVQKIGLLQRSPFSQTWSPHAQASFARRAEFRSYAPGDYVIREGQDNGWFYVLYEGELSVRRLRDEVAQLKIGDFFGEVSLLQNSLATATVAATTECRCLAVSKREFLQFLANDFMVGVCFEEISSRRLGRAIVRPQRGEGFSFDVIRD